MNLQSKMSPLEDAAPEFEGTGSPALRISLLDLWQVARMRAKLILGSAGAMILIVLLALLSLTPRYTGSALIALNEQQNNTINLGSVLSGMPSDQPAILTQIQILQSSQIAARVVARLKLDQDEEFNPPPGWTQFLTYLRPGYWLPSAQGDLSAEQKAAQARERIIEALLSRVDVGQQGLSTAIQIDVQSENPAKAALIANTITDAYIEQQLDTKFDASSRATKWIGGRLGELAAAAAKADAAVANYRAAHRITDVVGANGAGSISVLDQQIAQVNAQLITAQTQRAAAESNAARVESLVRSGQSEQVNQVVSSPLIAQYRQQEAQLAQQISQAAQRYGAEHPRMIELQKSKQDLDTKIKLEVSNVVGTVNNDVAVARSQENVLRSQLARLEGQSSVQGQDRIGLSQLMAEAASARALYDQFVTRSKETEQQQGLLIPDARVLSRASIPTKPTFPKKSLILMLTIPAALLLGYLIAFVIERLDNGFRVASRAEEVLGLPVFATLPDASNEKGQTSNASAADLVIDKPLSAFAESVRGLQMGIMLSNVDRSPKVVVVTSAVPGEGKTTTAVSLARHVAQSGQRVVIIDGDLRRPNVANTSKVEKGKYDLIDVLSGKCQIDEALLKDTKGNCFVLPVNRHAKNAPDLIESQAFAKVITQLRAAFDYVVIDSAPILPVNDTKILSQLADAVLFVVRWEQTPRNAAYDAIKMLREVHAPIAGVVLTRADVQRMHYYSFGYGGYSYAYSKYYES